MHCSQLKRNRRQSQSVCIGSFRPEIRFNRLQADQAQAAPESPARPDDLQTATSPQDQLNLQGSGSADLQTELAQVKPLMQLLHLQIQNRPALLFVTITCACDKQTYCVPPAMCTRKSFASRQGLGQGKIIWNCESNMIDGRWQVL